MYARIFFILFSLFFILINASSALAASLKLYDQPKSDAKQIGTIHSETGIIPIFSSQNSDWMKVGDPSNGNVGWVKTSDLNALHSHSNTQYTITQQIIDTGKGPQGFQIVGYGPPKPLTPEQSQAITKEMRLRQQVIEQNMQKMMHDMFQGFPLIMPVVIMPVATPNNSIPPTSTLENDKKTKK